MKDSIITVQPRPEISLCIAHADLMLHWTSLQLYLYGKCTVYTLSSKCDVLCCKYRVYLNRCGEAKYWKVLVDKHSLPETFVTRNNVLKVRHEVKRIPNLNKILIEN